MKLPPTNLPPTNLPPNLPPPSPSMNPPSSNLIQLKLLETSGEGIRRQGTGEVMTRPVVVTPIEGDETTIGEAVEGDFPIITHADGMTILDEHFPKSPIESRPLNSAVALD